MPDPASRLAQLSTAHLADGCLRAGAPIRIAPPLSAIAAGQRAQGRARPVIHYGSVDVFLESLSTSEPGDVLVVDNQGRDDEGCIGDLTALEIANSGLSGTVIWGRHRDTAIVRSIPIALFSRGACPSGPVRLDRRGSDPFEIARIGEIAVTRDDWVVADDDGIIFIADAQVEAVALAAQGIRDTEARQTQAMMTGVSLRDQLRFGDYLTARDADPSLDFRRHLRGLDAAIEE